MPIGGFLESLPSLLFIAAHLAFLAVGVWAVRTARIDGATFASAFWLYVASQVVFLAFFGGVITMKMAVLVEQMLIVVMIGAITMRKAAAH
jgi:uncharacterized membrane protein